MSLHQDIAIKLRTAAEAKQPIGPLRTEHPALDLDAAYAIARINVEHELSSGARIVGRKVGLTSKAVQTQLGVDQPDYGTLTCRMAYGDSEEIPWSALLQPKAEAEIALVLERDLTFERHTLSDILNAAAYALPAIEVVGSRIKDWDIRIVDTVADNASCGVFVLGGTPKKLTDFDPRLCGMVLERRGEPISVGAGVACMGHPWLAAAWLANVMVKAGTPLRAGDIVLTGALGPMVVPAPRDVLEARIEGLGSVRARFGEKQ